MNENGGKSSTILLTVIGIATLLVVVVGATFAYFAAQVNGNDTVSSLNVTAAENGTRTEEFTGSNLVVVDKMYPRDDAWAKQQVTLTIGNANSQATGSNTYKIDIVGTNEFSKDQIAGASDSDPKSLHDAIKVRVTDVAVTIGGTSVTSDKYTLVDETILDGTTTLFTMVLENNKNATVSFVVNLHFDNASYNQNNNTNSAVTFYMKYSSTM